MKINPEQNPLFIPTATHVAEGLMSVADKVKLDGLAPGAAGAVITWTQTQTWDAIVAQLPAVASGEGAIVMLVDNGTHDPFVMDSPANLDNVVLIGMGGEDNLPTLNVEAGAGLTGKTFTAQNINVQGNGGTLFNGAGPFQVDVRNGTFGLSIDTPLVVVDVNGNVALLLAGTTFGGATLAVVKLRSNANADVFLHDQAFALENAVAPFGGVLNANGSVEMDATCFYDPFTFDPDITVSRTKLGAASNLPFTPTISANWKPVPVNAGAALDQIAAQRAYFRQSSGQFATVNAAPIALGVVIAPNVIIAEGNFVDTLTEPNRGYIVRADVSAVKPDGTVTHAFSILAAFRTDGASVVTKVGATTVLANISDGGAAAWAADLTTDGLNIDLTVTGAAATNINWKFTAAITIGMPVQNPALPY